MMNFFYILKNINLIIIILKLYNYIWGLGIGDWGLGIGDWAQSPIPNPQSPIIESKKLIFLIKFKNKNKYVNILE